MHYKGVLPQFELAYETWGELNEKKDNAIILFSGMTHDSHAKSNEVIFLRVLSDIFCQIYQTITFSVTHENT